ncbi:MAG TPA: metallophosphoesterase [Burkholderiales bacterium]|nr:metallophosphoesterase [Burkholderiales bacterium]
MSLLLQVSDTHFGTERAPAVEALLELAAVQRPDLVVLSGDITQRARRIEFDAARRLVERLAAPAILAIPGNHDVPLFNVAARLVQPYAAYARAFGADLEPSYEDQNLLVVGVNTTRVHRHKHGEVSGRQIERVARRLAGCPPQKLRVVVTHHPMHVPSGTDEANLLRGHAAAARAWAAAGADLLMGGHIHLPYVRPVAERLPDLVRPLWAVQAGTAVSRRVRPGAEANSVNLVRSGQGACTVERWDHGASGRFALAERVRIALSR